MKISTDGILTTHVGSLPRPVELEAKLLHRERRELDGSGRASLLGEVALAVADVVRHQASIGLDVINDGEMSKYAYATYARERMTGLTGSDQPLALSELAEFPVFARRIVLEIRTPACVGPIAYSGESAVAADIANLSEALRDVEVDEAFMNASSPGIMAHYMPNQHYPTQDAYLYALAGAMKHEYDAIARSGFLLQVDCPDLCTRSTFSCKAAGPANVSQRNRDAHRGLKSRVAGHSA
jgi:5-methyltetrahydropteroyltriglutamate--homocysteine methyltransferase